MLVPSNITGEDITWVPTTQLRMAGRRKKDAQLQQLWKHASTGETEWRDIPFVHEGSD